MTSEIRANIIKNRVGLGTIEYSNTGPIISGVTTALNFKTGTSNLHNTGLNVQDLDVDGHTNLDNVSIAGVTTMTGNLSMGETLTVSGNNPNITFTDTNSNPDFKIYGSNGSFSILDSTNSVNRFVINSTGSISVSNDLDVDGHTNLDNVSIAGVTTAAGILDATNTPASIRVAQDIQHKGDADTKITFPANDTIQFETAGDARLHITNNGRVGINSTVPSVPLDVVGSGKFSSALTVGATLGVTGTCTLGQTVSLNGTNPRLQFVDTNHDSDFSIYGNNGRFTIYDDTNSADRLHIGSSGQIGLSGANYGSSGQVLTSQGSSSAPTWTTISGTTINSNADNRVITGSGTANTLNAESTFVHDPVNCDTQIIHNSNHPADLLVQNNSSGTGANARLTLQSGSNSNAGAMLGMITGSHAWYLQTPKNNGNLEFQKSGLKFRMDNSGDFLINDGNLVIGTAGHGIDFSADGSGTLKSLPNSFNAELLHDYEVGTFTPNIQYDTGTNRYAGSNVSSSSVGEYIRIGDLVSFGMKIVLTGNRNYSENTHIYIGGMPYNGMHSSQQSSMMNGWGGWACPTNDNNFSYDVRYCFHGYTTVNLGFSQSSGNGGISGFYVWGFYRTAP